MKILIIKFARSNPILIQANHSFDFVNHSLSINSCEQCQSPARSVRECISKILLITEYDFVFQHLGSSNREWECAIHAWRTVSCLHKVIGFRGGGADSIDKDLSFPVIYNINLESIQKMNWDVIPSNFNGDSYELMRLLSKQTEMLSSLFLLCQGYLTVIAALERDLSILTLLRWDENIISVLNGINHQKLVEVKSCTWWINPLGESRENVQKNIESELAFLGISSNSNPIQYLVACIYGDNLSIEVNLVKDAFCFIERIIPPISDRHNV